MGEPYDGACHCGAVRFTVDHPIAELTTCDCSLCAMRGALMARVPEDALSIVAGAEMLALYEWNTGRAKHHFCKACGVYVLHRKRAAPDHYGVNVHCLRSFDPACVPVRATEGIGMTIEAADARHAWPGPRIAAA